MKVPLKWLRDYVDLVESPEELAHKLTMAGLEVDSIVYVGAEWQNVYVGQVMALSPHPNADRLQLVQADYGRGQITLVTGATNLTVGDKVPVALVGARLIDGHSDELRYIILKPSKLRGVVSEGMVCSAKELGLGHDHAGILVLHPEAKVGAELRDELGDVILDLKLTPNRSDALSIVGVAREVAALTGQRVRHPEIEVPQAGAPAAELASVEVRDPDLCPRYTAMVVRNVKIAPSPIWMQDRLTGAGVRPISNVVDVTNYVMLELGQPLHAFDLDKVANHQVIVRRAKLGETLVTLDGTERKLTTDMLLIADPEKGIGLAGVMGGGNTEIDDGTKAIILESANFNPINNRRTAKALALPTEASRRFEKGLPPELAYQAVRRAMRLIRELAGGEVAEGIIDVYPDPLPPRQIILPEDEVKRMLGVDLSRERIVEILESLEFNITREDSAFLITVPPHRVDVTRPADLVEEVARIVGYEEIPDTLLRGELPPQQINVQREWESVAREALIGSGLSEIITYSLTSRTRLRRLAAGIPAGETPSVMVQGADRRAAPRPLVGPLPAVLDPALFTGAVEPLLVMNPLASESEALRTTALGSMLETLRDNLRHEDRDVDLFEIGRIYVPTADKQPDERRVVTIGLGGYHSGHKLGERVATDFFDLKGTVAALLGRFGLDEAAHYVPVVHPVFHPGRAAVLTTGNPAQPDWPQPDQVLGIMGEASRDVAGAFDIDGQRVFLATLDLAKVIAAGTGAREFKPLPKYPPVIQDVAVVVDDVVPAAQVRHLIRLAGGELLREVTLFDVYVGEPIPAGKKSLAYSLTYQSADHTLTDDEVKAVHKRIEKALVHDLGATIRGV
ncbi:MAG: phenylalanine--tRNA ligase subunit beta [Chloroflexota bacterium]